MPEPSLVGAHTLEWATSSPPPRFNFSLLAAGAALIWLGLPFGAWLPMMAAVPLAAALVMEISARRASRD